MCGLRDASKVQSVFKSAYFYFLPGSLDSPLYICIVFLSTRDGWKTYIGFLWLCHFQDFPIKWLTPTRTAVSGKQNCEISYSISIEFAAFTDNTAERVFTFHSKSNPPLSDSEATGFQSQYYFG